jgi:ABC-2 type transport system ATP-binding protein
VGVAQAIIHDPPLLILDEPTHDLDPVQIVEMRGLIQNLKGKHTVILSSHILPEIRETCDRLLVIASGRIVATGTEAQLTGNLLETRRLQITVRPGNGAGNEPAEAEAVAVQCARGVAGVRDVSVAAREDGTVTLTVSAEGDARAALARAMVLAGHDLLQLDQASRELENVFLELVGESGRARN